MNGSDRSLETMVGGGAFFECPRWHDGRLWVSDYWGYQVLAIASEGTTETVAQVPGAPSGLGWLPDDTLLVVSMLDTKLLREEAAMPYADLSASSGPQSNDMVVDAAGRAYVSTIDFEAVAEMAATTLVRVDPDGSVSVAAAGLLFPNGSVITPDGSTLIVAESWAQRLTAFDLQADGSLANRREWARFAPPQPAGTPGHRPSGAARPTGSPWTPRGRCGWPTPPTSERCGWARAARSSKTSAPATWMSSPAPWAARTGAPCFCAPPPTSGSRRRRRPGPGRPASSPAGWRSPTPAAPEMERMDRP
jgi:hypothetical protein